MTIFFDLDETLLDFRWAEANALTKTLWELEIPPTQETIALYSRLNKSQWELLERGEITREVLVLRRFDLLFQQLGIRRSSQQAHEIYEAHLGQGHRLIPGALETLTALYPRHALYLMSNGAAAVQDGRLKSAGIGHFFQEIFISQRVGFDKPRREFFEACFAAIPGFRREQGIIVGDSLTSDMAGGRGAGIMTCWFHPGEGDPGDSDLVDFRIRHLEELPGLIETIRKNRDP